VPVSAARLIHLKKQLEGIVRRNFVVRITGNGSREQLRMCQDVSAIEDETTALSLIFRKRLPKEDVSYLQKRGNVLKIFFYRFFQ
jgi:hypothetical protein